MTNTETPVSTLMNRDRRHEKAKAEGLAFAAKERAKMAAEKATHAAALTPDMLTPAEIEPLRQDRNEALAYAQKAYPGLRIQRAK